MPYKVKGKCIYKKDTGAKVGCTKGSVKKYLGALHANANEGEEKEISEIRKYVRKTLKENFQLSESFYHGSPYEFTAFDISKVGTGDSLSKFGWGLYFTDSPDTALKYAKELSIGKHKDTGFNIYEVKLLGLDSYLNWDESITDEVFNCVYNTLLKKGMESEAEQIKTENEEYGLWTMDSLYQYLEAILGSKKSASEFLYNHCHVNGVIAESAFLRGKIYVAFSDKVVKIINHTKSDNFDTDYIEENDYKIAHRIKKDETSSPLYDLLQSGVTPDDFYDGMHYYADMRDANTKESAGIIKRLRGKPNAMVTIYRAVPKGIKDINPGDWVTLSKSYAIHHGMHYEDPKLDMPVISKKVKASDVWWDSNDVNEFAYFPQSSALEEEFSVVDNTLQITKPYDGVQKEIIGGKPVYILFGDVDYYQGQNREAILAIKRKSDVLDLNNDLYKEFLREFQRRFNNIEELRNSDLIVSVESTAPVNDDMAKSLDIPYLKNGFTKKDSQFKMRMIQPAERGNVKDIFNLNADLGNAAVVCVMDDFITSGSTFKNAFDKLPENITAVGVCLFRLKS